MDDEVEIKITADASEAQKALRNTDFYIKALQKDTELLKDLQVEYKEALADTGGKLTGNALKLHEKILDIKASIAKSEREIEKAGKGQVKNQSKLLKNIGKAFNGKLGTITRLGLVAGGIYAIKSAISGTLKSASDIRGEYLSSIGTGLSPSQYSNITRNAAASGVAIDDMSRALTFLNKGIMAFNTNLNSEDASRLATLANLTGIGLEDSQGRRKSSKQLLADIQNWVKKQDKQRAVYALSQFGFSEALIDEMYNGNILQEKDLGLREKEIEVYNELKKSADNLSQSTKTLFQVLGTNIAPTLSSIDDALAEQAKNMTNALRENAKIGEQLEHVSNRPVPYSIKLLKTYLGGYITAEELQYGMSKYYGRELTEQEKRAFSSKAGATEYLKQLRKEREKEDLSLRRAVLGKENPNVGEARKRRIERGLFYIEPKKNNTITEDGKTYQYDKNGKKWEVLNISDLTVPQQISSLTGSNITKGGDKNVEYSQTINISGSDLTESEIKSSTKGAATEALQLSMNG